MQSDQGHRVNFWVNMRLKEIGRGAKFTLYALDFGQGDQEDCPALDFLSELERTNVRSHRRFISLLLRHADAGPIKNREFSNPLRDGVFEFKTEYTDRLLYFYEPAGATILTHGFKKIPNYNREIDTAISYRAQWKESS